MLMQREFVSDSGTAQLLLADSFLEDFFSTAGTPPMSFFETTDYSRVLNRLRFQKHLVGEVQIPLNSVQDGAMELPLAKSKESKSLASGTLRVVFDRKGTRKVRSASEVCDFGSRFACLIWNDASAC